MYMAQAESEYFQNMFRRAFGPPPEVFQAVGEAGGELLAVAKITDVRSPADQWEWYKENNWMEGFWWLDGATDGVKVPGLGSMDTMTYFIAEVPEDAVERLREKLWIPLDEFESGSGPEAFARNYTEGYLNGRRRGVLVAKRRVEKPPQSFMASRY